MDYLNTNAHLEMIVSLQKEYILQLENALNVCKYDCHTGEVIGIASDALASKPKLP